MTRLTIIGAQINPIVGDIDGNVALIQNAWKTHSNTDLIVFPELCLVGYPPDDLVLKSSFIDTVHNAVNALVRDNKNHHAGIIIGCPWRDGDTLYNALHVIHDGKIVGTTYKHILPNYGVFDDKRIFSAGNMPEPIVFKNETIGFLVCEDFWYPEPAVHLKNKSAEHLIVINASPYTITKHETRLDIARKRLSETGLPVLYINQWGGQDDIVFDGGSFAMDANGDVMYQCSFFEDDVLNPKTESRVPNPEPRLYKALVTATRDYVGKNEFSQIVLGLSGGVDSALVACIAADALGAENVLAVLLPSQYTSDASNNDALVLAKNLGIQTDTIAIKDMHHSVTNATQNYTDETGLTDQNIQSRIRGLTLMAISNATGRLLLSTGNKSEMATGYATLYGDMNGAFNPLKDVYKTTVYKLAEADTRIPRAIITKPPSAELKPDQTDQDSLPPYDVLDDILQGLIEREDSIDEIVAKGFDKGTVTQIQKLLHRTEYKRRQSCPGPKVTDKALSRDRRYPITNGYRDE